jgi:hypothetical protein
VARAKRSNSRETIRHRLATVVDTLRPCTVMKAGGIPVSLSFFLWAATICDRGQLLIRTAPAACAMFRRWINGIHVGCLGFTLMKEGLVLGIVA